MSRFSIFYVYLILALVTLAAFWQVHSFEFINYDDPGYVSQNPNVRTGLSGRSITWALTTMQQYNWHPVTWLSHMLDCSLFDLNPHWHHFTNLLLHILNTLLLATILQQMTGTLWPSAAVAAAFALHPLHAESVAWISERKDVLSCFFWLLTMICYVRYVKKPNTQRYLLTLFVFALGLMSKPMLVTLPFVLLLLDFWPLNRFSLKILSRLIWEKLPFFVFSMISCAVTFIAQKIGGAVIATSRIPFDMRLANTVISYVKYIVKMFHPTSLAIYYPYPADKFPLWQIAGAALILLAVSVLIILCAQKYKYLLTGWLWYLGTLVPVIGLVQVGEQTMADRYSYIPLVGLFIIIAWGIKDLSINWPKRKIILTAMSLLVFTALIVFTGEQLSYWRSSDALLLHALNVTKGNYLAHNNLGVSLLEAGHFREAIYHFRQAIKFRPLYPDTFNNLGVCYSHLGRNEESMQAFKQAIEIKPDYADAHYNLGTAFFQTGQYHEAENSFKRALEIRPDDGWIHFGLGLTYLKLGDKNSATAEYEALRKLNPQKASQLLNLLDK